MTYKKMLIKNCLLNLNKFKTFKIDYIKNYDNKY